MFRKQDADNQVSVEGECDTKPSSTLRSKGTLQKDVYEFSRNNNFNGQGGFFISKIS